MGKEMEGDNKQRRAAARDARRHGSSASEAGRTTGGSKQRTKVPDKADHDERLETTQRGEAKQGGADVPKPLRGKGRSREPRVPPKA